MLSDIEKQQYSKQILLEEFGDEAQIKLKNASVLVVGAGGLAASALPYLASSGVGRIIIVDGDKVEMSNLSRQTLFSSNDIGNYKAECAKIRLNHINPNVQIISITEFMTAANAANLIQEVDVVLDCTDNYKTRYLLSDSCEQKKTALVFAALHKYEGQISVLNYQGGPSYRDIFPDENSAEMIPSCVEIGVWPILPGILGLYQANEALKICSGIGKVLAGSLLTFNAKDMSTYSTAITKLSLEV
jgi:adenylyltransferase/sulfurtransferase